MRAFIAFELDNNSKLKINNVFKSLKEKYRFKWVDYKNYHITIKFLGNITRNEANEISKILDRNEFNNEYKIFIKGIGAFPNLKRARVLFLNTYFEKFDEIKDLVNIINDGIYSLKIKDEKKEFIPHLTIARMKIPFDLLNIKWPDLNINTGVKVAFFESILTPGGPIYKKILS